MQDDINEDPAWNNLLSWLHALEPKIKDNLRVCSKSIPGAGRGLFTTEDIPPNTPLFTVPESAHINATTLSPLYMDAGLTATQIISMHLFLHRPGINTDTKFGPYISILPQDFEGHPLSWLISSSQHKATDTVFLIDCLPPAARRPLSALADRFWEDWKVVSQYLEANTPMVLAHLQDSTSRKEPPIQTYLWAWLNVNTRCVYHRMCSSASDPDNLTLCPLLDLANHSSSLAYALSTPPIPTFFSPPKRGLKKDDEIFLRYGSHSNITLFTEYGFVEKDSPGGGQADIQDIMESLFQQKGALGEWMKATLESTNYWGDWTLHDTPAPAHPSYRLLPALRLMQLSPLLLEVLESSDPFSEVRELQLWHEIILGQRGIISPENEEAVWQQLLEICNVVTTRAEKGLERLQHECQGKKLRDWGECAVEAIRTLWLEERRVTIAVIQSIKNGEALD